jgi:UDP:flavonoid glycosyltransferase YjiC (YdhE family)
MSGKDISKNKVFQSPYKSDIEQRLAMGQSPRSIANWLKTRGEEISYVTINEYKKNYFNVDANAGKIVKQKQEELKHEDLETQNKLLETQNNMQLANIRAINHVAVLYNNMHDMMEYLAKLKGYDPIVASHAARGIWAELRTTIETLEKLKDKEGTADDSSVAKLLSAMKKKKRELEEGNYE